MKNGSPVIDVQIEYCRKCGSCLDSDKRCTGCGKQYFHIKKGILLKLYAVVVTLVLVAAVYQNNWNVKNTNDWIDLYNEANTAKWELLEKVDALQAQNGQLSNDWRKLHNDKALEDEILRFYVNNAVLVTKTGSKYHKYGCYHLNNVDAIWIYNTEAAKGKGYTACADCWEEPRFGN